MDKIERVQAAIRGDPVDRIPASFWFHFPEAQRAGHAMAEAHLAYYRAADPDFLKVMNDNYYSPPGFAGLATATDWRNLRPAPLSSPCFEDQLSGLREIVTQVGDEALVVSTIFNPFENGDGLSGWKAAEHLRADPEAVSDGLATIAESLAGFARACIEAGAAGLFFAAHGGGADRFTEAEFDRFIQPHDLTVLRAAKDAGATFTLLHICGENLRMQPYARYPADVVNWSPQLGNPSLRDGRRIFGRTVLGGVDQRGPIVSGSRHEIAAEVRRAIREVGATGFMVGAGCTVPGDIPIERLAWAREAVLLSEETGTAPA